MLRSLARLWAARPARVSWFTRLDSRLLRKPHTPPVAAITAMKTVMPFVSRSPRPGASAGDGDPDDPAFCPTLIRSRLLHPGLRDFPAFRLPAVPRSTASRCPPAGRAGSLHSGARHHGTLEFRTAAATPSRPPREARGS